MIERIDLTLPTPAAFFDRPVLPTNRMEAVCSVQFTLALVARKPRFLPRDFEEDLTQPDQLALMAKIDCTIDDSFGKTYPGHWPAHVQLHLNNGRLVDCLCPIAPGDPGNELSTAERREKFCRLAMSRLGEDCTGHLAKAVATIETLPDVGPVLDAFHPQENSP